MIRPLANIRRFDVFAEYSRIEKLAEGIPADQAKGYGLWLAKVVAAKKFGRLKPEADRSLAPEELAERARKKFRSLSGVEQTDKLFDREIVARMGREFYASVFRPAIDAAFKNGESYKDIRDSIRKDWQVRQEEVKATGVRSPKGRRK